MLNCREVTRLVSQSMETRLRWYQWLGMRIHLLYCVWCRRYASQIHFLHKACPHLDTEPEASPSHTLSADAKDKMRARLQEAVKNERPLRKQSYMSKPAEVTKRTASSCASVTQRCRMVNP